MPISRAIALTTREAEAFRVPLESGVTAYQGGFVGIKDFVSLTAANRGVLDVYDASDGMLPVAPNQGHKPTANTDGDDSSAVGVAAATVDLINTLEPYILPDVPVTGVVNARDVTRFVYLTDDDVRNNLTLTANGNPVGIITRYHTGTRCAVLCFGFLLGRILAASGYGFQEIPLCLGDINGVTGTTGAAYEAQQRVLVVGWELTGRTSGGGGVNAVVRLLKNGTQLHPNGERLTITGNNDSATALESNITEDAGADGSVLDRGDRLNVNIVSNGGVTGVVNAVIRVLRLGG